MRCSAILMVLVVLLSAIAPVAGAHGASQVQSSDNSSVKPRLVKDNNVDGRNSTSVEIGSSTFGILYGTEGSPGFVTLFTRTSRYLGEAEVEDRDGTSLGKRSIKALSYSQHTITQLVEYTDSNRNGLYDAQSVSNADASAVKSERRVMTADLSVAWHLETDEYEVGDTTFYLFTLTAWNVTVRDRSTGTVQANKVLGSIELEFVLQVDREVTETSIPVYRVKVEGQDNEVRSVHRLRNRTARTIRTTGSFKYNVTIDDWPVYDVNNSMILLTRTSAGVIASPATEKWAGSKVVSDLGINGEARFEDEDDKEHSLSTDERTDTNEDGIPESLSAKDKVSIADNGDVLADLTWVDNATVDGRNVKVRFSVLKVGYEDISTNGKRITGLSVVGGFVYPAGSDIFHDPGIEAEGTEVAFDEVFRDLLPAGTIMVQVVAGAAVAVLAFVRRRK